MPTDANNVFVTNQSQFLGRGNGNDPFIQYSDFPNTDCVLDPREGEWTPTTLGATTKTYRGSLADITAIATWCQSKWFSYKTKELPSAVFQLTITTPYEEITNSDFNTPETVTWEILPNTIQRNIFDAGIFVVNASGTLNTSARYTVPPEVQAIILKAIANNDVLALTNDAKYAPLAGIAQQFYAIIKSGQQAVRANLHNLKRTATFNINNQDAYDNYPIIQLLNEGLPIPPIIGTTDLINLFQVDQAKRSHLIPSYSRMKTSTSFGDPVDLVYKGGYLIGRPQTSYLTPTKVQITQLFEFDEWNDCSYPIYGDPISSFPFISNTPYPPGYTGR